jgi:hypothetical protein
MREGTNLEPKAGIPPAPLLNSLPAEIALYSGNKKNPRLHGEKPSEKEIIIIITGQAVFPQGTKGRFQGRQPLNNCPLSVLPLLFQGKEGHFRQGIFFWHSFTSLWKN